MLVFPQKKFDLTDKLSGVNADDFLLLLDVVAYARNLPGQPSLAYGLL